MISPSKRVWPVALASMLMVLATIALASPATAHDPYDNGPLGIVNVDEIVSPSGSYDDAYNGYKVYLSSPRHSDSGSRGECTDPGRQENENGRNWNWRAAKGAFVNTSYLPTAHTRNLHARGYSVQISRNSKDNGYLDNRTDSQNWSSDIHIVTHTNATGGCASTGDYFLVMWNQTNDQNLAAKFTQYVGPYVPGSDKGWQSTGLAELNTNAANGDVYVELQFHDNPTRQSWLFYDLVYSTWRYGVAVDNYLGYP